MWLVSERRHGQTGRRLLFHSRGIAASREGTAANCRGAAVKFEACWCYDVMLSLVVLFFYCQVRFPAVLSSKVQCISFHDLPFFFTINATKHRLNVLFMWSADYVKVLFEIVRELVLLCFFPIRQSLVHTKSGIRCNSRQVTHLPPCCIFYFQFNFI